MLLKNILLPVLFLTNCFGIAFAQNNNGQLDDPSELVTRYTVPIKVHDSIALATDIYLPILQDDISYPFTLGATTGTLKLMHKGTQYMRMPNQVDPLQLPLVLARTPYNKQNPTQGMVFALLGYAGAVQDMRGRYASEGVYIPMYSDSWDKTPYHPFSSPLDITGTANQHEDGFETVQFIVNRLRFDSNGDGALTTSDRLVTNGSIGMFGASALGNAQYQAAAAHRILPSQKGLKCLMPIVGSGEFFKSTGFPNGVFREKIITGWLGGQLADLDQGIPDPSLNNTIHTPTDYNLNTISQVQELSFDAWTTLNRASYPNSPVRADLDISRAPVNGLGEGQANGPVSRYTNMNVPAYHMTGWWDIFIDGQIETWQQMINHLPAPNKHLQKLVIGPWTHQTIGARDVGDMAGPNRYKANVTDILKVDVSEISSSSTPFTGALLGVIESELLQWYRYNLGEPFALVPANDWQYLDSATSSTRVKIPAQDYAVPYIDFINFLNGGAGLDSLPVEMDFGPGIPPAAFFYNIPATGQSAFGDTTLTVFQYEQKEFNSTQPGGVANARLYVTGPINDGIPANQSKGNYWLSSNEFPIPQVGLQPYFLHANGKIDTQEPITPDLPRSYTHNPDNPVVTIGGGNMLVQVPGGGQLSQGQMNLANPAWRQLTMDSARVLHFETDVIMDSLSVIGFPEMRLYARTQPNGATPNSPTDTDFVVRVLDVYPDGREIFITEGTVNARARMYAASIAAGAENDNIPFQNVPAGQLLEYRFRMLPLAHTFGQGHKLKVLVSSSNYPRYQSNPNLPINPDEFFRRKPNDGQTYTFNGTPMAPRIAVNSIHFSPTELSAIYLPVYNNAISAATDNLPLQTDLFNAYPNPAAGIVQITAHKPVAGNYAVKTLLGQTVITGKVTLGAAVINIHALPTGTYFIQLQSNSGKAQTIRFVKH